MKFYVDKTTKDPCIRKSKFSWEQFSEKKRDIMLENTQTTV